MSLFTDSTQKNTLQLITDAVPLQSQRDCKIRTQEQLFKQMKSAFYFFWLFFL
ncbi:hypothetical protein Bca4012_037991 [Brassica carinata]